VTLFHSQEFDDVGHFAQRALRDISYDPERKDRELNVVSVCFVLGLRSSRRYC